VECGLCAYVCVSKIPILQYIALAKHELARVRPTEDANA
jgi:electron transport complex protein RnfC